MGNWPHPRLLYDRATIDRFLHDINTNAELKATWQKHLQHADELLAANFFSEEYADAEGSQHGNYWGPSGQISDMALYLGLAYQVTGESKYAAKLREALLYYAGYKKWYGKGLLQRQPPWHSELNTARFCYGFALSYDAIYSTLSLEERATIADAVIRLGILPTLEDWVLPETRIHAMDSMGHNWWSVCVAEAGLAALALLGDEPRAEQWVDAVCRGIEEWFAYKGNVLQNKSPNFDDKGAMYESVNYANYGVYEYLLFRLGYINTYGMEKAPVTPILDHAGDFFLHTCYPTANSFMTVDFGDGSLHSDVGHAVALLLANGYRDPKLSWYLDRTNAKTSPLALLHCRESACERPHALGTSVLYPEIGWAVMRSSWDDNATLMALKSGFTWNHAHADAGSFIIMHAGMPLVIDSGTCSYGRPEYKGYYCQSQAHNVLLFNNQGQDDEDIYRGVKYPGEIHSLIEHEGLRYCYADATGPMARYFQRNYRHFLWLGNVILVIDDIRAYEPGRLQWLLHYEGEGKVINNDLLIANGPARARVRMLLPENVSINEEVGLADHNPDKQVHYFSFSPAEETRETKFITAIVLDSPTEEEPILEPLQGPGMLGVRITQNGKVTDVYLNLQADGRSMHSNSCNEIAGWETDAYLLVLHRQQGSASDDLDTIEHCFIACGSYLRRGGKVVFDSLSKADVAFTQAGDGMSIAIEGQPLLRAAIRAVQQPTEVRVNGELIHTRFSQREELVRVSLPE